MPEHRRTPGEHAGQVVDVDRRQQCRREALCHIQRHHRDAEPSPVGPPDVGRADVSAAGLADVRSPQQPHEPVAGRNASGQVAGEDEEESGQLEIR